jgi:predicted transcriptional regulator
MFYKKNTISRKKKERRKKYSFWRNKQTLKECSMDRHLYVVQDNVHVLEECMCVCVWGLGIGILLQQSGAIT